MEDKDKRYAIVVKYLGIKGLVAIINSVKRTFIILSYQYLGLWR